MDRANGKIPSAAVYSESYKEINSTLWKQKKTARHLETRATNLVFSYVFFQALVLFLSISQTQRLKCGHWWVPLSLISTVAVMFFMAFIATLREWRKTLYYADINWIELENTHLLSLMEKKRQDVVQGKRKKGTQASLQQGADPQSSESHMIRIEGAPASHEKGAVAGDDKKGSKSDRLNNLPEPDAIQIYRRNVFNRIFISALLGYTGVIITASRVVICNTN